MVKKSIDIIEKATQDGTLEIEKANGKLKAKAGILTITFNKNEIERMPKAVKEKFRGYL